jgi:PIN domain nuclease of toxin-antitoxin system
MNLLLDTHAAIWFITEDPQLPSYSKEVIENPENQCFVSIASLWEIAIKHS